jgi:hypothetical protein
MLFTNENESFIHWIEELENYSQKYIYNNRSKWFESDLEMNDIENSFTPTLKLYKSGKFYIVRTIVPTRLGKCILKIFNENEMDLPIESIQESTNVITIWEIQGIKCSSRSFQIDIEIKQMMVLQPSKMFEKCIIGKQPATQETQEADSSRILVEQETMMDIVEESTQSARTTSDKLPDTFLENNSSEDVAEVVPSFTENYTDIMSSTQCEPTMDMNIPSINVTDINVPGGIEDDVFDEE